MTPVNRAADWFRAYKDNSGATVRLLCLPHAGGAPTAFLGWQPLLPDHVQVLAACYPGRQDRLLEPCLPGMEPMADAITAALVPYLDLPIAIFGHSMGSAIGYEVALRLEKRHGVRPAQLFVSGRAAPHRVAPTAVHEDSDAALLAQVRSLGGTESAVLEHPELRELLLPSLRADYTLIETYRPAPSQARPVGAPIVGFLGDTDPACTPEEFDSWSELTTGPFESHIYPGGHFFLTEHEKALVTDIAARL